jgi:HD-GYP domain-containing protein (c-di-GMP phosphodiesterase class II)
MHQDSTSAVYLRFAGASFVAFLIIAVTFGFMSAGLLRSTREDAATRATVAYASPLLRALEAPGGDAAARAGAVGAGMLAEPYRAVQVLNAGGTVVYAGGSVLLTRGLPSDGASATVKSADGRTLFVTGARAGGYSVAIAQDDAPIQSAIFRAQRALAVLVAIFAVAGYIALQGAYWLGVNRLVKTYQRLLNLYNRGDEIRSSLDMQEVVAHLSRDATTLARGEYGMVALFDEASGDLTLQATYEHAAIAVGHHTRRIEEWYLRRCVVTNTPVTSTQSAAAYRPIFGPSLDGEGRTVAMMCVPISMHNRPLGALAVLRDARRGGFTQSEIAGVEALASQGVMAVEQAQLFAKVRSHANEIELSYDATLKALMAALDAKDEVTEGHCERVAKMTVHLAREMGLEGQALVDIERGALLHDVGKIGVPDAVLKKPKALNDQEWEAMRKHPLLAGLMVSKIGFLEGALPVLLYHHERYDGQGYPFGLARDAIPLEARIFMVIDAYDAMTSDRPYRAALSHEEAMAEIASHNGTQFDSGVVHAFGELMSSRPDLRRAGGTRVLLGHDDDDHEDAVA